MSTQKKIALIAVGALAGFGAADLVIRTVNLIKNRRRAIVVEVEAPDFVETPTDQG